MTVNLATIERSAVPVKMSHLEASRYADERRPIATQYREAGFTDVANKIEAEFSKKLKLATISELGYKMLTKKHFQDWLDALPSEAEVVEDRDRLLDYISSGSGITVTGGNRVSMIFTGSNWIGTSSISFDDNDDNKVVSPDTIATRKEAVMAGGKRYSISIEEIPVENYQHIPPADVLSKIKEARECGVFDKLTVAYPTAKEIVEDPLVLGKIKEMPDTWFYIAEWGDDIKLEDLI